MVGRFANWCFLFRLTEQNQIINTQLQTEQQKYHTLQEESDFHQAKMKEFQNLLSAEQAKSNDYKLQLDAYEEQGLFQNENLQAGNIHKYFEKKLAEIHKNMSNFQKQM